MLKKEEILAAILHHQDEIINDFEVLRQRYQVASDIDEEDTKDVEDLSRQGINTDMLHNIEMQVIQAKNDRSLLTNLDLTQKTEIAAGSVVMTDKFNFFVSIPNHGFKVGEVKFVGIAVDAPIYQFMRGKKAGESFSFNKIDYKILAVY